jgi:hypothetical protein
MPLSTHTGANICQLGEDQRKVNMLARDYMNDKVRRSVV